MFDWVGSIFKGIISVFVGGLALIGIGTDVSVVHQATTTPPAIEIQATTTLSEIDELRLALEQGRVERLKLEEKISASSKSKSTTAIPPAAAPLPNKKIVTFTTPNGAVIDEAGNVISGPTKISSSLSSSDVAAGVRLLSGEEIYSLISPSVVLITSSSGTGSGFAIKPGKYILTNDHVVRNAETGITDQTVTVKVLNGATYKGYVLGSDKKWDIALIYVSDYTTQSVKTGSSDPAILKVGGDIYVLGYPLDSQVMTLTKGVVSANRQSVSGLEFIQTDATTHPGNSGGPVVNNKGEVIGVHDRGTGGTGIALSIPIETALSLVPALSQFGQSRYEVYPIGSTQTIKKSVVLTEGLNDKLPCSQLGFTGNDLTMCNLHRSYYKDYQWSIIENN